MGKGYPSGTSLTLVVRNLMPGLVDTRETEVAVLAHFAVLGTIDDHGVVSRSTELFTVRIVDCETDGLASKPITWVY